MNLVKSCEIFTGMSCSCYESIDVRCTMSKMSPLAFVPSQVASTKKFHSIDLKFDTNEDIRLEADSFVLLNQLLPSTTRNSLSITLRFESFRSFQAKRSAFNDLFKGIQSAYKRLTIELHPTKAKSITFDANAFDFLEVNELSIYGDSLSSPFESIFNRTNITHLNIEGAIIAHEPSLVKDFDASINSLKITRMIDAVNSEEFPPFPVQSYTIEAHKMRSLDGSSFINYKQLTGINIIQPDVSITPKILNGLENLSSLKSMSIDAERIADGALKHVKHIETLILGAYLKILDTESLNSLKHLKQLDVRYVQFSTLQGNTSCALADFINRRRMTGLDVYLPDENIECDCILVFLNNMVDDGSQLTKCQSANNDRCLFSSCSIVSEYFTRKQKEDLEQQEVEEPLVITPSPSDSSFVPFIPPSVDLNDNDYPDVNPNIDIQHPSVISTPETNIYDEFNDDNQPNVPDSPQPEKLPNHRPTEQIDDRFYPTDEQYSTPMMRRVDNNSKSKKFLTLSWVPFAIVALCLFIILIISMIGFIVYHRHRTNSFKLVPQAAPII